MIAEGVIVMLMVTETVAGFVGSLGLTLSDARAGVARFATRSVGTFR